MVEPFWEGRARFDFSGRCSPGVHSLYAVLGLSILNFPTEALEFYVVAAVLGESRRPHMVGALVPLRQRVGGTLLFNSNTFGTIDVLREDVARLRVCVDYWLETGQPPYQELVFGERSAA